MTLQKYPKMKDSGVEWIGEIPESWNVAPLKFIGKLNSGGTPSTGNSEYWDNGTIPWISSGEVNNNSITKCIKKITKLGLIESSAKLFPKESVLIAITGEGATRGRTSILKIEATTNQSVVGIVSNQKKHYSHFIWYYLQSQYSHLRNSSHGSVQSGLNLDILRNYPISLQKILEQKQIVNFLDGKTKIIDQEISKSKKLIELIKEKRQSLINHVVTKGLDDSVPMKDSGIDWVGDIPEDWKVSKIKFVSDVTGRIGYRGYTINDIVSEGEGAITLSPSNIIDDKFNMNKKTYLTWKKYEESPEIQIFENNILLVKTGSTIGKVCMVPDYREKMTINPQLVVLKPFKITPKFLLFFMTSNKYKDQIYSSIVGGSTPTISQQEILNHYILFPPRTEQNHIISYIDKQTIQMDKLISKVESQISKLQEFRESLILSAVTGKICVTN
ncbi:restriction endonuclease subunit S [Nitrosopumilus sp.]|uniref:restriction endonuclease subunit S n=1 Tax=Nitrosopumilus sp. TaxID=2024843 RepID=UPI00247EE499|nr:restriction endonuclease subunit S [Nitrosopumilus sp.]MCV0430715.1 restriction endonuclease subunit S [Nitrosopumilus sp.]